MPREIDELKIEMEDLKTLYNRLNSKLLENRVKIEISDNIFKSINELFNFENMKDYNNTVILCTSENQGLEILNFYNEKGYHTHGWTGTCLGYYYGVSCNHFRFFAKHEIQELKIITLPQEKTFPREMWVWNYHIETAHKHTVHADNGIFERKYIASFDDGIRITYLAFENASDENPNKKVKITKVAAVELLSQLQEVEYEITD